MYSCLQMKIMTVKKCSKFQSHTTKSFDKTFTSTKTEPISKSKKGHNSAKIVDRVRNSCLQIEIVMINKCSKFQSHKSNSFYKTWTCTKSEPISKTKKGHNSAKILDRLMSFCLQVDCYNINKCSKFEVNTFDGIQDITIS